MKKGFGWAWFFIIFGILGAIRGIIMIGSENSYGFHMLSMGFVFVFIGVRIGSSLENKQKEAKYKNSGGKFYYLAERNKTSKPFTLEQLKDKDLTNESLIWTEGMDDWKMLKDIPELSHLVKPKPATSVPPPIPPQYQK